MLGLLVGFALGAMAFTEQGREAGNKIWDAGSAAVKKAVGNVQKSTEQSPRTTWDGSDPD